MLITDVEERDGETVFWLGSQAKPKQFGVVVLGPLNIHSQGIAESVAFGQAMLDDLKDDLEAKP
jgi:hypothetical protein